MSEVEHAHSQGSTEMSPPASRKLRELFLEAAEIEDASARATFLDQACGNDADLRRRLEALLAADQAAGPVLPQPVPDPHPGDGVGSVIGRYKLLQQIGEGGCGIVYMAEQVEPVRRQVALKIIKLGMDTRSVIARFEAERQALALMDHPNIAKVHDAGTTETGRPYFVMELVRGIKITDYCDQNNLSTRQRLDLFVQVCDAVQHAHQKGVIHRDLKPSNILVTQRDEVPVPKVIDFGIAKAITDQRLTDTTLFTAFEQFLGTPAYMSPEQAELSELGTDTRSDIYSLGVLLYELLTGSTPFDTQELLKSGLDQMRRTLREEDPPTPSARLTQLQSPAAGGARDQSKIKNQKSKIPSDLDWIVMRCLEKDRARRYETANGLARDIERHLNNEPVTACPPSKLYRLRKMVRRNKGAFASTAVILVLLVLGVGVSTRETLRARRAEQQQVALRQRAEAEADKSKQVAQFLGDMLAGVGPSKALGRDTTMLREILDKTAERVGKELTNQPRVEFELRDVLARTYNELGLYTKAEDMARENLRLGKSQFGEDDVAVAQALKILGDVQFYLANYAEAEKSDRAALAVYRKVLGEQDPEVATCLDNIANALQSQSRLREAEALHREALAMRRKLLGNDQVEVAVSVANLAFTLQEEGKLAEAEALSRESLDRLRKLRGNEHPEVATALNNLGLLLSKEAKYAEEEAVHREALAMRRKLLPNDHPDVAQSLHNLAVALQHEGNLIEAESVIREALALQQQRWGSDHRDVAFSLNTLGNILHAQGKLDESEAVHREALRMRRKLLGNEHQDVASSLVNLAGVFRDQGRLAEAETTYREALAIMRTLFGEQNPQVAAVLSRLASVLDREGRPADAEPLVREAWTIQRKVLGDDHPETVNSLSGLASLLVEEGKLDEAQALDQDQVAGMRARLPADDPALASAIYGLAVDLVKGEKVAEAEPLIRECLAIREKRLPDDWRTFNTRAMLGDNLLKQQKYAQAEPLLLSGYHGLQEREAKMRGPDRAFLKKALQNLSQLYEATGRPDQAAEWKKKLDEFEQSQTANKSAALPAAKAPP
jgi:serine/threonine protein kinase